MLRGMAIRIGSLAGFLTALERQCLETEVARQCAPFLALPADHALARRMTQMFTQDQPLTLASRLAFAQTFAELVTPQLCEALNKGRLHEKNQQEVKVRLRQLISQIPESELPDLSLGELAKQLHCCERHASRLFREEWGTSFPSFVSEIRLKKACHLLLQRNLKIIEVALESGHGSLAHFNYVFKKRFHITPTEWREQKTAPPRRPTRAKTPPMTAAAVLVWLMLSVAGISRCLAAQAPDSDTTNQPVATATNAVATNVVGRDSLPAIGLAAAGVEPSPTNAVGRDSVEPLPNNTAGANATSTNAIAGANTVVTNAAAQAPVIYKLDRFEVLGNTLLTTNRHFDRPCAVHWRRGYGSVYRQDHQWHGRAAIGVFPPRLVHRESRLSAPATHQRGGLLSGDGGEAGGRQDFAQPLFQFE